MCQTACPVSINTGDLVRRLREPAHHALEKKVWSVAASKWNVTTKAASAALSAAAALPASLDSIVLGANGLARAVMGTDVVPLWSPEMPSGGRGRARPAPVGSPELVYLPACVNVMFGPAREGAGVQQSFEELCARAGILMIVPSDIDSLCCGTPWSSKGLSDGGSFMKQRMLSTLRSATRDGELPVVCDASSCSEGLVHLSQSDTEEPRIRVIDVVDFVAERILPNLPSIEKIETLVLHPTCSSERLGINTQLEAIAHAVAEKVVIPDAWGCCAFAGDRGMLHPELTASATREQAAQVRELAATSHASCNRTCELGMTRATGSEYQHVIELLASATRPGGDGAG